MFTRQCEEGGYAEGRRGRENGGEQRGFKEKREVWKGKRRGSRGNLRRKREWVRRKGEDLKRQRGGEGDKGAEEVRNEEERECEG